MQGVYWKGGLIMDLNEEWDKGERERVYGPDEDWRSEDLAAASIVKCRKVSSTTFFTKGLLNELGYSIKDKPEVNVIFINSTLTSMQLKKLEKRWNDILADNDDRLRSFNLKSANKGDISPTELESETEMSALEISREDREALLDSGQRKIRVIDRFGIILQIFAARAKHRSAQLQIELAWLRYAKTLLSRGGAPNFGKIGSMFTGNLMR